jgi:hypothetical protein
MRWSKQAARSLTELAFNEMTKRHNQFGDPHDLMPA